MSDAAIIKHEKGNLVKQTSSIVSIANKLLLPNLRSFSILHLDDHTLFATGIHNCLTKKFSNISIKHIQNGHDALKYVITCFEEGKSMDLIITDLAHMGLDGISFTKAVRELEFDRARTVPIIFITMHNDKSIIAKGYEAGCTEWLTKDVGCEQIRLTIYNHIKG